MEEQAAMLTEGSVRPSTYALIGLFVAACSPPASTTSRNQNAASCNASIDARSGIADANLALRKRDARFMYLNQWQDDSGVVRQVLGVSKCALTGNDRKLVPFSRSAPNQDDPACSKLIDEYAVAYNRQIANVYPEAVIRTCGPSAVIQKY